MELRKIGTGSRCCKSTKTVACSFRRGFWKISAKQSEVRVVDAPKHNAQKQVRRMVRRVQSQIRASGARPSWISAA